MTTKEFGLAFNKLAIAYRGNFMMSVSDTPETKKEILSTCYEFFKEYDAATFDYAVTWHIRKYKTAPTISELLHDYNVAITLMPRIDKKQCNENLEKVVVCEDDDSNLDEWTEDRKKHPFSDGWRIDDDGYWVNINV